MNKILLNGRMADQNSNICPECGQILETGQTDQTGRKRILMAIKNVEYRDFLQIGLFGLLDETGQTVREYVVWTINNQHTDKNWSDGLCTISGDYYRADFNGLQSAVKRFNKRTF